MVELSLHVVDGHGNFGSMDGDGAVALKVIQKLMASKIALEMLFVISN